MVYGIQLSYEVRFYRFTQFASVRLYIGGLVLYSWYPSYRRFRSQHLSLFRNRLRCVYLYYSHFYLTYATVERVYYFYR
jgi:hypothetical protein